MTAQTAEAATIADVLRAAAQIVRQRGHDRRNESPHDVSDDAPLSVFGAVRAAAYDCDINTDRTWMPLLGRLNDYWRDTLGVGVWQWEWEHRDRDVTAEAADHLDAAANHTR